MITALLDVVGSYLATAGFVGGSSGWTLASGWMPPTPDHVVALFEYSGGPPQNAAPLDRPGLQIRVRGDKQSVTGAYTAARLQIERIRQSLHASGAEVIAPNVRAIVATQSVFPLGLDDNDRIEFACNFECWISRN